MPKSITPSITRRILAAYPDFTAQKIDAVLRLAGITKPSEFDSIFSLARFHDVYTAIHESGLTYQEAMNP